MDVKIRVLKQGNSIPMVDPQINFLYLIVSDIFRRQDFKGQGHYSKGKGP